MDRIIVDRNFDSELDVSEERESSKISFEYPHDLDIFEFKTLCVRIAASIGYSSESIEEAFGEGYPLEIESLRQAQMTELLKLKIENLMKEK